MITDKVLRGEAADQLLKSEVYQRATKELEAELTEQWLQTRPEDKDGRERLYLMAQIMADLGRILIKWQGDARIAHAEAERAKLKLV